MSQDGGGEATHTLVEHRDTITTRSHSPGDTMTPTTLFFIAVLVGPPLQTAESSRFHDLAHEAMNQQDWDTAETYILRAIDAQPREYTDASAMYGLLGFLYRSRGEYTLAEQACLAARRIAAESAVKPDDALMVGIFVCFGDVYRLQRSWAEAEPFFEKALALVETQMVLSDPELVAVSRSVPDLRGLEAPAIREFLGPSLTWLLDSLAQVYGAQGKTEALGALAGRYPRNTVPGDTSDGPPSIPANALQGVLWVVALQALLAAVFVILFARSGRHGFVATVVPLGLLSALLAWVFAVQQITSAYRTMALSVVSLRSFCVTLASALETARVGQLATLAVLALLVILGLVVVPRVRVDTVVRDASPLRTVLASAALLTSLAGTLIVTELGIQTVVLSLAVTSTYESVELGELPMAARVANDLDIQNAEISDMSNAVASALTTAAASAFIMAIFSVVAFVGSVVASRGVDFGRAFAIASVIVVVVVLLLSGVQLRKQSALADEVTRAAGLPHLSDQ